MMLEKGLCKKNLPFVSKGTREDCKMGGGKKGYANCLLAAPVNSIPT